MDNRKIEQREFVATRSPSVAAPVATRRRRSTTRSNPFVVRALALTIIMTAILLNNFLVGARKQKQRPMGVGLVQAWSTSTSTSTRVCTTTAVQGHRRRSRSCHPYQYYHHHDAASLGLHLQNRQPFFQRRTFFQSSSSKNDNNAETKSETTTPIIPSSFSDSSWEASDWAIHVSVPAEDAPISVLDAIEKALLNFYSNNDNNGNANDDETKIIQYTAQELLELGSTWYLPAADMNNVHKKPSRLLSESHYKYDKDQKDDGKKKLQEGDYLRIHHNPRRFPAVHLYDWTLPKTDINDGADTTTTSTKERLVIEFNSEKNFLVLNKPAECIPVHMTVDNSAENIVSCLRNANPKLDYVTTPHRLDQNTSGLITLATSKPFAAYFAKLMRHKTASEVPDYNVTATGGSDSVSGSDVKVSEDTTKEVPESNNNTENKDIDTGVHKAYRCLVCLVPPPVNDDDDDNDSESWSVDKALRELQTYATEQKVMRHYLEPSVRAPKRFVATLPEGTSTVAANAKTNKKNTEAGWAECLMRIQRVGTVCALRGNTASDELAAALWDSSEEAMPPSSQAVVEVDIELLTGRTHQIRGQLSTEGFPLVGDMPYGGSVPSTEVFSHESNYNSKLALQCRRLEFLDPDVRTYEKIKRGVTNTTTIMTDMVISKRWNNFELDTSWWTPFLTQYHETMQQTSEEEMTTMAALDIGLLDRSPRSARTNAVAPAELNPQGLPPQAILSPGRHKYIIAKAIDPNTGEIHKWFVKSASVHECGPYHRDVAEELVEWINACGYQAIVTGGGRILYQEDMSRALVYGFSYGYGRGDHALAVKVIKEWSEKTIDAAYDDSPELY